jgi:hypothetical protein
MILHPSTRIVPVHGNEKAELARISTALNHTPASSPGLSPAIENVEAQSKNNRGGRDKPGHDRGEVPSAST